MTSNVAFNELRDCLTLIEDAKQKIVNMHASAHINSPLLEQIEALSYTIEEARTHLETARALLTHQATT